MKGSGDITRLLQAASGGDRDAGDALFQSVYRELRAIARRQRRGWHGNDTLNTTALINEAYLRLAGSPLGNFRDRTHFFATASRAMRQILINYAERESAVKRGGDRMRVTLSGLSLDDDETIEDIVNIHSILNDIESRNPRCCRVFECRVFGGMTVDETADALDISAATVKRDWSLASAWVYSELEGPGSRPGGNVTR